MAQSFAPAARATHKELARCNASIYKTLFAATCALLPSFPITLCTGAEDTVGTTGIFEVSPNAVNSVPREARLGIGGSAAPVRNCDLKAKQLLDLSLTMP